MTPALLSENVRIVRSHNAGAAGTTDLNGASLDLQTLGAQAVLFLLALGTLTASQVTTLKAQSSPDDATWTDIAGGVTAAAADADSNKVLALDIRHPPARYVRAVVDRGTANAVVDAVLALPYDFRTLPATQSTTYLASLVKVVDPAS